MKKIIILVSIILITTFVSGCTNTNKSKEYKVCINVPGTWFCVNDVDNYCVHLLRTLDKATKSPLIGGSTTIKTNDNYRNYKQCIIDNKYLFIND